MGPDFGAISRRTVIGGLITAGLYTGGVHRLHAAAERADVIVLGAGLSGLYTALLLEEQGLDVIVLEASGRVGGRVRTETFGGLRHELGASDIGVMYARVLNMMNETGLKRVPSAVRVRPFSYHIGGRLLRAAEWAAADVNRTTGDEREIEPARLESTLIGRLNPLQQLDDWLKPENAHLDIPIGHFLANHGISDAAIDLIGHTMNGNGTGRTSALAMLRDATRIRFGIESYLAMKSAGQDVPALSQVEGGNQRLPEAMAGRLRHPVRFGRAVTGVVRDARGLELTCRDGERFRADFAVCAIPLTAMRNIGFEPVLAPERRAATAGIEYYSATKFYLQPTAPFWEQDGYEPSMWTDGPIERIFAGTDESGEVQSLLVWINGDGSRHIDELDRDAATRFVLEAIAELRPASRGRLEVTGYHSWGRTPYAGGCNASFAAGQVRRFAASLPAPEDRLFFAGEHTRRSEFGMESAMASAERAVTQLLEVAAPRTPL